MNNLPKEDIEKILEANLSKEEYHVINKISEYAQGKTWWQVRDKIGDIFSKEEFKTLYSSEKVILFIKDIYNGNKWIIESLMSSLFYKHHDLGFDIVENSKIDVLIFQAISEGYFKSIEDINALAKSNSPSIREFAVTRCGQETLRELRKDSSKKIRLAAYKRLGIDEFLDEMLEDKSADIRYLAARYAPMHYYKFKDMPYELSKKVFREIAKKINPKEIPYILGNRNTNDKYIKEILGARLLLNSEEDE